VTPENTSSRWLPAIGLHSTVVFPGRAWPVVLLGMRDKTTVEAALLRREPTAIAAFAIRGPLVREPGPGELYRVGTIAAVQSLDQSPCGKWFAALRGLRRVRATRLKFVGADLVACCDAIPDAEGDPVEVKRLETSIRMAAGQFRRRSLEHCGRPARPVNPPGPECAATHLISAVRDLLAHLSVAELQTLLETEALTDRLEATLAHIYEREPRLALPRHSLH
jgi:ATP-dependent Lon protease